MSDTDALDAGLMARARELAVTLLGDLWRARDVDAIHTALKAERVRGEWQPVETAPKDGTLVDLHHSEWGRHADCYWGFPHHECGEAGRHCDSEWHGLEKGWVDATLNEVLDASEFTHWMSRPPAPALSTEETDR